MFNGVKHINLLHHPNSIFDHGIKSNPKHYHGPHIFPITSVNHFHFAIGDIAIINGFSIMFQFA